MAGKSLQVSPPALWPRTCSENFHKTNENFNSIDEMCECSIDNLHERHLTYEKFARGNHDVE